jgi:protein-tyrosine phosphatase
LELSLAGFQPIPIPAHMASTSPHRVLFVCLGNICRSPAAEIIFRKLVAEAGREADFEIDSAGTISHHCGAAPDSRMASSLTSQGYRVEGKARQIQPDDLERFDLIVTMDESNLADVRSLDPAGTAHRKIHPFVSFCRDHDDLRVPDPYYGGQRGFDHVIRLLEDGCEGILGHFKAG